MAKQKHRCKQCRRTDEQVGKISRRGLCTECAAANMTAAAEQISAGEGPYYDRQQAGYLAVLDRVGRPETPYGEAA